MELRILAFILIGGVFVSRGASGAENLTCYQCIVEDNSLCEDDLKPCPKGQAFDRCVTILKKTQKDGFHIEKKCGLAPCTLRDQKHAESLGLDQCDRSREEFECLFCCQGNGCNKDGVERAAVGSVVVLLFALILTVITI